MAEENNRRDYLKVVSALEVKVDNIDKAQAETRGHMTRLMDQLSSLGGQLTKVIAHYDNAKEQSERMEREMNENEAEIEKKLNETARSLREEQKDQNDKRKKENDDLSEKYGTIDKGLALLKQRVGMYIVFAGVLGGILSYAVNLAVRALG